MDGEIHQISPESNGRRLVLIPNAFAAISVPQFDVDKLVFGNYNDVIHAGVSISSMWTPVTSVAFEIKLFNIYS